MVAMRFEQLYRLQRHVLWSALLVCATSGCLKKNPKPESDAAPPSAPSEESEFAEMTPDELFTFVRQSQDDYAAVEKMFKTSGGGFRLDNMRKLVDRCLVAGHCAERHETATTEQVQRAIDCQIRMTALGLEKGWAGFDLKMQQLSERLAKEYQGSLEAATSAALVLKYTYLVGEPGEMGTIEKEIELHVIDFPEQPTGPKLYAEFARLLLAQDKLTEAERVCRDVSDVYGDSPLARPVNQVLADIKRAHMKSEQQQAYYLTRSAQFGGKMKGYFVLFLRPKKLKHGSPVDYVVCHGLRKTISMADAAESFEFEGWFPDTRRGCDDANAHAEMLKRKNTYEVMTYQ